jgi:hypothetical protein
MREKSIKHVTQSRLTKAVLSASTKTKHQSPKLPQGTETVPAIYCPHKYTVKLLHVW